MFFLSILSFSQLHAQAYDNIWLKDWENTASQNTIPTGRNLSITAGGFVYEAIHQVNANGLHDMVLEKRSLSGTSQWIDTFNLSGTTATMLLGDMVLDSNADIIISGSVFNGTNSYDAITIKYENNGQLDWYQLFNGAASSYDGGLRVNVGTADQIYVTGGSLGSSSDMDLMVLSYSASGSLLWSKTFPQYTNFDVGSFIDENAGGLVRVASLHEQTGGGWQLRYIRLERVDGQINSNNVSATIDMEEVRDVWINDNDELFATGYTNGSGSGRDVMTVKFTSGAAIAWTKIYDSGQLLDDEALSLATTANGGVVVGGFTQNSSEGKNGLLLSYSSGGNLLWSKTINGAADQDDEVTDLLLDESNDLLYLCGQIKNGSTADYLFAQHQLSTGNSLEQFAHAGKVGGDDRAESLLQDAAGGILISGKTDAGNGNLGATTVRYVTKDYFLPPNTEAFNDALPYLHQQDQLLTTAGKVAEDIRYYAGNHFLQDEAMNIVQTLIDTVMSTPDTLVRVDISFGNDKSQGVFALDKRATYNNYYLGHITEGRVKVPLTDKVIRTDAWTGIDILHSSNNTGITYDFIVEPGINPSLIELTFDGHSGLTINSSGELEIATDLGTITWPAPTLSSYDATGNDYPVTDVPTYSLVGTDKVAITGVNSNTNRYLVIGIRRNTTSAGGGGGNDNLEWCTYYGGNYRTFLTSIDTKSGSFAPDLYHTGYTRSTVFPVLNGFQEQPGGEAFLFDAFLSKFDGDLNLSWSTLLGGAGDDQSFDLLIRDNDIIIVGTTEGQGIMEDNFFNFPLVNNGTSYFDDENKSFFDDFQCFDSFISIFNDKGSLEHSTFFGRDDNLGETIYGIAEDKSNGDIYVVGEGLDVLLFNDFVSDFFQPSGLSFFSKFDSNLNLLFSTKFDAKTIRDVQVDLDGNIFIAGEAREVDDIPVVAENSNSYTQLASGNPAIFDVFITKVSPLPHEILWSTYFGGDLEEEFGELAIGASGDVYFVGETQLEFPLSSDNFPFLDAGTQGTIYDDQPSDFVTNGYFRESFFAHFSQTGTQLFTTLLGEDNTGGSSLKACETFVSGEKEYVAIGGSHGLSAGNDPGLPVVGTTDQFQNDHFYAGFPASPNVWTISDAYFLVVDDKYEATWGSYLGGGPQESIIDFSFNDGYFFVGGNADESAFTPEVGDDIQLMEYTPNPDSYFSTFIEPIDNFGGPISNFLARFYFDEVTATETLVEKESLYLYPNPAKDMVYLNLKTYTQSTNISIYNMLGQKLQYFSSVNASDLTGSVFPIQVDHLPAGSYILTLEDGTSIKAITFIRQ